MSDSFNFVCPALNFTQEDTDTIIDINTFKESNNAENVDYKIINATENELIESIVSQMMNSVKHDLSNNQKLNSNDNSTIQ